MQHCLGLKQALHPPPLAPSPPPEEASADFHSADSDSQASDGTSLEELDAKFEAQSAALACLVASLTLPLPNPLAQPPSLARPQASPAQRARVDSTLRDTAAALGGVNDDAPWQQVKTKKSSRKSAPSKAAAPEPAPPDTILCATNLEIANYIAPAISFGKGPADARFIIASLSSLCGLNSSAFAAFHICFEIVCFLFGQTSIPEKLMAKAF